MRWITFLVLLFFAAALQTARLGALAPVPQAYPMIEYLPLLAVIYALFADEHQAPLAGVACGLVYDVFSQPFGVHTIALGLVALSVVKIRMSIFREHIFSQFIMAFLAILIFGVLAAVLRELTPLLVGHGHSAYPFWPALGGSVINAFYTACVAPAVVWCLFRFAGLLGFHLKSSRGR
ncbi:MAG: rod shape-determining protein MreD [Phycisphaerae bacterium]